MSESSNSFILLTCTNLIAGEDKESVEITQTLRYVALHCRMLIGTSYSISFLTRDFNENINTTVYQLEDLNDNEGMHIV